MIPHLRFRGVAPDHRPLSSQCLEIADFRHADCIASWCRCDCGHPHLAADGAATQGQAAPTPGG